VNDPGSRREMQPRACFGSFTPRFPVMLFRARSVRRQAAVGNASLRAFAPQICAILIVQNGARIAR
jgi:hypothetical protein